MSLHTTRPAAPPPAQDLVVPAAIDNSLPDYLVRAEAYAERMRVRWQPGDRFRMFFGGKISSKTHKKVKTGGARWLGVAARGGGAGWLARLAFLLCMCRHAFVCGQALPGC